MQYLIEIGYTKFIPNDGEEYKPEQIEGFTIERILVDTKEELPEGIALAMELKRHLEEDYLPDLQSSKEPGSPIYTAWVTTPIPLTEPGYALKALIRAEQRKKSAEEDARQTFLGAKGLFALTARLAED